MKLEHTEFGFVKDKGQWKCYCSVPSVKTAKGNTWRPNAYGKTKRLAREKLEEKLHAQELKLESSKTDEADKTESKDISNTLVEQLKRYAIMKQAGVIKAVSRKIKVGSINDKNELNRNLVEPYSIGKMEVDKITRKDVADWLDELKADGKGEERRKGAYNLLTDYYNNYYCIEIDVNFISPATGFKFDTKKSKADPMKILDNSETKHYLKLCEEMGEEADVLQFILYMYCRAGEATTLTWSDWDKNNLVHFHSTWTRDDMGKLIVDRKKPKTESSDRCVFIPEQVKTLLIVRYADAEAKGKAKESNWIFPAVKDPTKALSESTVWNRHKRILREMYKVPRLHDLRHSGISFNIRNSANKDKIIGAVSRNAGHSTIGITTDIYQHVLDTEFIELANYQSELYKTVSPLQ